mgnify:CR=1 FL=1
MKKKFYAKNLVLFLIPLMIPLLILGTLSIYLTQRFIKEDINKNNLNLLKQTKGNIELMLNELDTLNLNYDVNSELTGILKNILKSTDLSMDDMKSLVLIRNYFNSVTSTKPFIHSIYVYYDIDGTRESLLTTTEGIANLKNFYDMSWHNSYLTANGDADIWTEAREIKRYNFEKNGTAVITLYKRLHLGGGVLIYNISPTYIQSLMNELVTIPGQSIAIISEEGHVLFGSGSLDAIKSIPPERIKSFKDTFFTLDTSTGSYIVSQINSSKYGWKYISTVPQQQLYRIPLSLSRLTLSLLVFSFGVGVILTYYLTRKNYRQVKRIISILDSAENGNPLPPLPNRVKDEYGYIIQNILRTFIEHSFLKVQLSERKYMLQAMEMVALQSQINPHFLYNTLHSIYWEVMGLIGKPSRASQMIENLSDILEYSLSNPRKTVTLGEEIKNTKSYVEIQKMRYLDKFKVVWEYSNTILDYQVIKLLLQPLVENSIYHGIKEKEGCGTIKIKVFVLGSFLRISVVDNGLGIDREALVEIRHKLCKDGEYSEHIGLYNTNKRLKLAFGEEYCLSIRSKKGLGTAVYATVPM